MQWWITSKKSFLSLLEGTLDHIDRDYYDICFVNCVLVVASNVLMMCYFGHSIDRSIYNATLCCDFYMLQRGCCTIVDALAW
jgi:hypothetical protein